MPDGLEIGLLVLSGVFILIGLVGGSFKLFGAEVASSTSNLFVRLISFLIGASLLIVTLQRHNNTSTSRSESATSSSELEIVGTYLYEDMSGQEQKIEFKENERVNQFNCNGSDRSRDSGTWSYDNDNGLYGVNLESGWSIKDIEKKSRSFEGTLESPDGPRQTVVGRSGNDCSS